MSIFLPETSNPESNHETTGNYTIPAGKFAHMTAVVEDGQNLIIDGTTIATSQSESLTAHNISQAGAGTNSFVVPAGSYFDGAGMARGSTSGSATITVDGALVLYGSNSISDRDAGPVKAGPGATVQINVSTAGTGGVAGFSRRQATSKVVTQRLTAGTVVTGSARKSFAIYSIP